MDHGDTSTHQLASAHSPTTEGGSLVDRRPSYYSPHVQHVSAAEFVEQSASYTQQAVRELKASPDFKKYMWRCHRLENILYSTSTYVSMVEFVLLKSVVYYNSCDRLEAENGFLGKVGLIWHVKWIHVLYGWHSKPLMVSK